MIVERVFGFLITVTLAGILGFFVLFEGRSFTGALTGMLVAAVAIHLMDLVRAHSFFCWLRAEDHDTDSFNSGYWQEAAARVRKIIKLKDQTRIASEDSLRHFLAAIQASPNGVLLLDPEFRIQWCNQTAAQHLGIDPRLDSQQLIGNLLRNPVFSTYVHTKAFEAEVIIEGRLHRVDRPHKVGIQIFPYGDGRMLLLSRDVTSIEQAEVMRRDFVANVSHEIRTPLTVLLGFVETLQTLKLTANEQGNYLELMGRQALRMKSLVEDLLTLSKLEGSPFPSLHDWSSLTEITNQCEEDARGLMKVLKHEKDPSHLLIFETDERLKDAELAGASNELASAFNNLISNALRYTPPGGKIWVKWTMLDDGARFSVEDSGPGISEEHLPRLSERFYRIDRSRSRETGGTGLGLAIVKHVIQRHGGQLKIESKSNQGSKFSLWIPGTRLKLAQAVD